MSASWHPGLVCQEPPWFVWTGCDDVVDAAPFVLLVPESTFERRSHVRVTLMEELGETVGHMRLAKPGQVHDILIWQRPSPRALPPIAKTTTAFGTDVVDVWIENGSLLATTEAAGTFVTVSTQLRDGRPVDDVLALCFPLRIYVKGDLP